MAHQSHAQGPGSESQLPACREGHFMNCEGCRQVSSSLPSPATLSVSLCPLKAKERKGGSHRVHSAGTEPRQ